MDSYVKTITLDVNADQNYTIIKVKQGDKINRKIAITLKKDGSNFTPTGVSEIWFRVEKPDKNIAIVKSTDSGSPISVSGNVYTVSLSEQCLTASGKAWCDLAFLDSSGNTLSSCAFIMNIIPMPNGNTAESISEWTDLQKAIDDAERFADIVAFRTSGNYIQYTVDGQTWTNLVNVGAIGGDLQTQINAINSNLNSIIRVYSVSSLDDLAGAGVKHVTFANNIDVGGVTIPRYSKGIVVANSTTDATLYAISLYGTFYFASRNGGTWKFGRSYDESYHPIKVSGTIGNETMYIDDTRITENMELLEVVFGSPENVPYRYSWTTSAGRLTFSGVQGTFSQTTVTAVLGKTN